MNKKLAEDLKIAKKLANENIIQSSNLPEMTFRRLKKLNWLKEITKGWYILKSPEVNDGESTIWYANFWAFLRLYLEKKYKNEYCLNPTSSIFLKTESNIVPVQVVVILKRGGSRTLALPFGTSILFYQDKKRFPENIEEFRGINIVELAEAITLVPESFYSNYDNEAELALLMIKKASEITRYLLDNDLPVKAHIIAGAYQFLKKNDFVKQIKEDMEIMAYTARPRNPFKRKLPLLDSKRIESPAVARIEILWKKFRKNLDEKFPAPNLKKENLEQMLEKVDSIYVHDAYNSLSIEGYSVTEELIQKVADGSFDAELNDEDKKHEAAMAAKGYYLAFQEIKKFIKKNYQLKQDNIEYGNEIQNWYKQLFTPKIQAGGAKPSLLTGYRNKLVLIRGSRHSPVNYLFVSDAMEKYLELLGKESSPWIKALLGHFILVYIHPYSDGNGRTARFLMNAILVLSGYSWTVIRQSMKLDYFKALEMASVGGEIDEFADFILNEQKESSKFMSKL